MRLTYLAFVFLGLLWGSNFIYMKWAAALISPAQIVLLRVFFGFLPLAFVAWRKRVIARSQLRLLPHFLVMAAVATAFYYYAIVRGTELLPSGIAGVLGGSISLFTAICSLLFLRTEKLNRLMALGVVLGFAGIVLIARPWEGFGEGAGAGNPIDPMGVFWMLSGAVILGVSYVYVRRFLSPHNLPPLALVTWQIGLALLIMLASTSFSGMGRIVEDPQAAFGVVIGLGVLGTGVAFLIYYYLLQQLGAVASSGATYITPVVALAISRLAGEQVGLLELAAAALVLASIALLQIGRQRAVRAAATQAAKEAAA
jgi:drug/metabolite transporter (DMT)-like permease